MPCHPLNSRAAFLLTAHGHALRVRVNSDGTVFWSRPGLLDTLCKLLGFKAVAASQGGSSLEVHRLGGLPLRQAEVCHGVGRLEPVRWLSGAAFAMLRIYSLTPACLLNSFTGPLPHGYRLCIS